MIYNSIAIIQARMGSSRLPGKMSKKLGDYSILEWVIKRVSKATAIDHVILATSTLPADDCLCKIANDLNISIVRGSETDVLSRFCKCSALYESNSIVRVCADNPFVDPGELNRLVRFFSNNKVDYAFNNQNRLDNGIADGFGAEVFSTNTLRRIISSNPDQSQCEHVTKFIWDNPDSFSFSAVKAPSCLNYSHLRFDVDSYDDFDYLNSLVECGINIFSPASQIVRVALCNPFLPQQSLSVEINNCLQSLFPLCRSITGENNRETLAILSKIVPLSIHEVPSGTQVFDWTIPNEWNIKDAYIATEDGKKIIDFQVSNLHVLSYSEPIDELVDWNTLSKHLFYDHLKPLSVPYRTSYYSKNWGFCVSKEQFDSLANHHGMYHVCIDSNLTDGSLTYGELIVPGKSSYEVLISCYICHPSMANDSLSGFVLTAFLARYISSLKNNHWTYRFIFVPETVGAITYLHQNQESIKKIDFGFVITTVGGPGVLSYKQSWDSSHFINSCTKKILSLHDPNFITYDFDIHGSDERQYSSPGFRINCVSICKDKYYEYPQYHTSDDDLSFVTSQNMLKSFNAYIDLFSEVDSKIIYKRTQPNCELMLSKHDLYPKVGGSILPIKSAKNQLDLILWVLFYTDGRLSVDCIASNLSTPSPLIQEIYDILLRKSIVTQL